MATGQAFDVTNNGPPRFPTVQGVVVSNPALPTTQPPAINHGRPNAGEAVQQQQSSVVRSTAPPTVNDAHDGARWDVLPPGWTTCRRPGDGRIYYCELSTGKTSWSHPLAVASSQQPAASATGGMTEETQQSPDHFQQQQHHSRSVLLDTPSNAVKRPESHQCCACASLLCMPPLGLCALFHSRRVDTSWKEGRYGDAVDHSKQAYNYAWFGVVLGLVFIVYWCVTHDVDWWPDFNFD